MKVQRKDKVFIPITFTLETKEEFVALWHLARNNKAISDYCREESISESDMRDIKGILFEKLDTEYELIK